jgi:hypothetical protein
MPISSADRTKFATAAAASAKRVEDIALRLVAAASPNPPNVKRIADCHGRPIWFGIFEATTLLQDLC